MKAFKIIILLILISSSKTSFGQIIFNGETFNLSAPIPIQDAGTNSYAYSVTVPMDATYTLRIFRYDGFWYKIEQSIYGTWLRFRTENPVLSMDPPCSVNWHGPLFDSWSFLAPPAAPNPPTIPASTPILKPITGSTCYSGPARLSVTLTPSYLTPPSLTSAAIALIPSPPTGSIVWDSTAMCLKVFNGTAWVCL